MAWKDSLLDASFRGRTFSCVGADDRTERGVALHEYPFRDGGEGDDMGRKARRFTLRAVFWGDDYEAELAAFVKLLDQGGEGELVHPVYGALTVLVLDYDRRHDPDNVDRCDVAVSFVESGKQNSFFASSTARGRAELAGSDLETASDALKGAASQGLTAWIKQNLSGLSLSERLDVGEVLTGALEKLNDVAGAETTLVDYLDFPEALVSDLEAVSSKTADLAGFDASDAAGRFRGWQRLSDLFPSLSTASSGTGSTYATSRTSYAGSLTEGAPSDTAEDEGSGEDASASATDPAYAAFIVLAQAERTGEVAQAATDLLVAEADEPTLCPAEVEAVVGNTRARLQDCIDAARDVLPRLDARRVVEAARDAALAVQTLGLEVISALPPLVERAVADACNHHLLAHRLYGDYTRAAQILRLNPKINAPNDLRRGTVVAVYAE